MLRGKTYYYYCCCVVGVVAIYYPGWPLEYLVARQLRFYDDLWIYGTGFYTEVLQRIYKVVVITYLPQSPGT